MIVRSLYVVNLVELIMEVNKSVLDFRNEYGIVSVNDLTNLFISRMLMKMVNVYKEMHEAFIVFYLSTTDKAKLLSSKDVVNYKKFLTIIGKKIHFPLYHSSLTYEQYVKMLFTNCPEYEEIMTSHKSFAECLPAFAKIVHNFKYHKINKEVVKDLKALSKCICSL